jgi:carboxylesterase 2
MPSTRFSGAFAALSALASLVSAEYPIINTTTGYVRGTNSGFREGVTVYRGIPYAAPPTGSKRWTAPTAAESWSGVLNATEFGPQCAQSYSSAGIFSSGKTSTSEGEFLSPSSELLLVKGMENLTNHLTSIDCLTLNIWTPTYNNTSDITSRNLPVFFWIFGGRFEGGSGDVKTYDGTRLATKDMIVVTMNYRLGAFGYLAHPELSAESGHNSSGNYGILDQQFALKWVHDNIKDFGGNPNQVTVGGQSAGSASSLLSMWSPLTKGLVQGVIAESGARAPHDPQVGGLATSHRNMSEALTQGEAFLKTMNVTSIAALRNVSTEALIDQGNDMDTTFSGTVFEVMSGTFMDPPLWRPVVDGYVFPTTTARPYVTAPIKTSRS